MEIFKRFHIVTADSTYLHVAQTLEARELRIDGVLSVLNGTPVFHPKNRQLISAQQAELSSPNCVCWFRNPLKPLFTSYYRQFPRRLCT